MPANDESDVGDDVPDFPYMTPEERKFRWLKLIEELSFREKDLLHFLWNQGADPRPPGEVRELIHEVMNGAAEVPAELYVVVHMLVRQQRRLLAQYAHLEWCQKEDGSWTARVGDFTVILKPQSGNRWRISCYYPDGDKASWRPWAQNLDVAKKRALASVEEAQNDAAWHNAEDAKD